MQQKVVFIVGPTGVGKTALALSLAKRFAGDLVSADSVQVYKHLDIISGKDIPKDSQFSLLPQNKKNGIHRGYFIVNGVRIFLLDVVEPTFSFTVSQFIKTSTEILSMLFSEKKLPIVVGGTGLYIKALTDGIDTDRIKPDMALRDKLNALSVQELQDMLPVKTLEEMSSSDKNNKRRLARGIEILKANRKVGKVNNKIDYKTLTIGLCCEREMLRKRIEKRVDERIKAGALIEAKELFKNYESLTQQVKDANGYKQLFGFLKNEVSYEEAIYRWKISEYRHAKNQMTWFKKYGDVNWFDIAGVDVQNTIETKVAEFLT